MFNELNNDTKAMTYTKLSHHIGQTLHVDEIRMQNGKYGINPVVVDRQRGVMVTMPKWSKKRFDIIMNTPDMAAAVRAGHLAIDDIREITTENGTTVTFRFKDC